MPQLASDNFNRANGPLGANWTDGLLTSSFSITGNAVVCSMPNNAVAFYNAVVWPADQYSECAISGLSGTSTDGPGLVVRCDAAGNNFYWAVINADGDVTIAERVGGGGISNIASRTSTWVAGDVLRLEIQGTTIKVYQNGVQLGANITDASIATGNAGLAYGSGVDGTIDNWAGGDFAAPPTGVPVAWIRA